MSGHPSINWQILALGSFSCLMNITWLKSGPRSPIHFSHSSHRLVDGVFENWSPQGDLIPLRIIYYVSYVLSITVRLAIDYARSPKPQLGRLAWPNDPAGTGSPTGTAARFLVFGGSHDDPTKQHKMYTIGVICRRQTAHNLNSQAGRLNRSISLTSE